MRKKKIIGIVLVVTICTSCFSYVYGGIATREISVGQDDCNTVVEKITKENNFTEKQKAAISSDVETLKFMGLPVNLTESISEKKNYTVYELEVAENIVDRVVILEDSEKRTRIQVSEGKITNILEYNDDGEILLDGKKIKIIDEESKAYERGVLDDSPVPCVEGVTYTKKAPKEVKSWRGYRENWICSSVKLQKKIGDLAIGVVIALLTKTKAGGVAGVFSGDALTSIKRNDPYTTGISYKIWVANSKVPTTSRYNKLKKRLYSRVNFKKYSKDVIYYSRKG